MCIRTYQSMTPQLQARVFVDPTALVLGDVAIGTDSSVWPMAVIRGDMQSIRIGARTSVQDGSVLHITHASSYHSDGYPLQVGDEVTIGHRVILHGCTLGNRILVGMGSMVMDGVSIADEVIIGAGSLVPPGKKLASGYLYVGSPVRAVRLLSAEERLYLPYTANNYVALKERYLSEENASKTHHNQT